MAPVSGITPPVRPPGIQSIIPVPGGGSLPTASGKLPDALENHVEVLARRPREVDTRRTVNDPRGVTQYTKNDARYAFEVTQRENEVREMLRPHVKNDGTVNWQAFQKAAAARKDRYSEVYAGLQRVDDGNGSFQATDDNFGKIGVTDQKTIDAILAGIGKKSGDLVSATEIAGFMAGPANRKMFENDPGLVQAFGVHALGKAGKWEDAKAIASYDFKGMDAVESRMKFQEISQLIIKFLEAYQHLVTAWFAMRRVPGSGARGVVV